MKFLLMMATVIAITAAGTDIGWAQGAGSRTYTPARPTLSPYLNYFRRDVGAVSNYHTFVRPAEQLRRTLNQQNSALQANSVGIRNLQSNVQSLEAAARTQLSPTGRGATFMNYSHYYNFGRTGGARR